MARAVRGAEVQVGNSELHGSHSLSSHRGVWWCLRCGYYTTIGLRDSKPKMLRKQCNGKANNYGKNNLDRLRKGLFPAAHRSWPVQETIVAEEGKFKLRTKLIEKTNRESNITVEQNVAGSSNDHISQGDVSADNLPQGLVEGEDVEQAMMWQGLDDSD